MAMGQAVQLCTELTAMCCGKCGGVYAIGERFRSECYRTNTGHWHCPYCDAEWCYRGETEEQRLRWQLRIAENNAAAERARHDQTKASLRATKAVATRRKKQVDRIEKGVCPHCRRTFQNLQQHMQTKHGKW